MLRDHIHMYVEIPPDVSSATSCAAESYIQLVYSSGQAYNSRMDMIGARG